MAFAALIYLTNTIEQNLHHHLIPDKQQIGTLLQEATFLQNFLENSLQKDDEKVERLESQIRDVAYRATDIVESHLVDGLLSKSESLHLVESFVTFNEALEKVIEEIHSIKQEVMKDEDEIGINDLRLGTSLGAVSSNPTLSGESTMVGLAGELEEIRTRLIIGSSKLQILSILGMGGIGTRIWEEMEIIGSLPNLQVLKIKNHSSVSSKWELKKGGFLQLKVLLLETIHVEEWLADSIHFPQLQRLVLKKCRYLKIPSGIGEIPTLQSIELFQCGNSAITSAKQIQEEQEDLGNDSIQVLIIGEYQQPPEWSSISRTYRL